MRVLNFIGRFLLFLAFLEVVLGLWIWLAGHDVTRSAGEIWYELAPGSLNLTQAVIQRYLHPEIWEQGIVPLLVRPFWESEVFLFIGLLVVGSGLVFFAHRRPRPRTKDRA